MIANASFLTSGSGYQPVGWAKVRGRAAPNVYGRAGRTVSGGSESGE